MWPIKDHLPDVKTLIGVTCAVFGNMLISVALNVQKYAHNKLERRQHAARIAHVHNRRLQSISSYEGFDDHEFDTKKDYLYLHSPLWWLGIFLMVTGEVGNFIAYAFAPASVVAPLGTVALISNVILAPMMLHERFRKEDLWGIFLAVVGAVIVVLCSRSDHITLSPSAIWGALTQTRFLIYFIVTVVLISTLLIMSEKYGRRFIVVDLLLVALFGGYTVLSTKAISSLLTLKFVAMLAYPITYLLLFVLVSTAVLQVHFLNKALQRFDSTQVIPTQFVFFTISAIVGSSVLYNDFKDIGVLTQLFFCLGCGLTFLGVFFITSNRDASHRYGSAVLRTRQRTRTNTYHPSINSGAILYDPADEFEDVYDRRNSVHIPRRHTLDTPDAYDTTALLGGESEGLLRSLIHGGATSLTAGVLGSVGSRYSHALGLDQVFDNYGHHGLSETDSLLNGNNLGLNHRRSQSVPSAYQNSFRIQSYQNSSPLGQYQEESEYLEEANGRATPSSYDNSSYYYDSAAQTDDEARTAYFRSDSGSGYDSSVPSTDSEDSSSRGHIAGDYSSDEDEELPDLPAELNELSQEGDLPDLPVRRDN